MKNALNYYYDLNPTSIHQINKEYRCYVGQEEYLLTTYEKTEEELNEIYELSNRLLQNGIPCHQILLNNQNQIITPINKEKYILMKIFVESRNINVEDIPEHHAFYLRYLPGGTCIPQQSVYILYLPLQSWSALQC